MGNSLVKSQLNDVKGFLTKTITTLEDFLNETTIKGFNLENEEDQSYIKLIFSNLRKLIVYSEEGFEACSVILQSEPFQKAAAEKTLYKIYHNCIEEFFAPKNDAWFENSRSAYTGRNAIKYYRNVPEAVSLLIKSLEGEFQRIREELEYYETDYRTKMIQSK
ncbi:YpuI family protein [Paenibacillus sp. BSR1-1]|uniref:YpuI family protein n=1 Tax=Paenibacillus sp. BSR1-1 TaxID=3020845 RepID=UPI0025B1C246|nr:YpuI family protein [Paenibacillus sp. BSR1-1]MDN3016652.1 YpuI family protein [Paenibacillus sp. BSR1-1]